MVQLSVIIVTYNNQGTIKKCLDSVLKNTRGCEVIMVDNYSEDGTMREVREIGSRVQVIASEKNLGFARGNNLGVKKSSGEYLVFLNPDTEVVEDGSLNKLVSDLKSHRQYGLIGPKITYPDGKVQTTVRNLPTVGRVFSEYILGQKGSYDFYDPMCPDLCRVESVVGACMVISKELFETVGGFDERYFLYYEDLEICRQILNHGLEVGYQPRVVLKHKLGSSGRGGEVSKHLVESAVVFHGWLEFQLVQLCIRLGKILHG